MKPVWRAQFGSKCLDTDTTVVGVFSAVFSVGCGKPGELATWRTSLCSMIGFWLKVLDLFPLDCHAVFNRGMVSRDPQIQKLK